ncbi:nitroreductase family protein [Gemmatimonadota bacterium]
MGSKTKLRYAFHEYSKDDLMEVAPEALGGILRERVHHMIEVPLYPTLLKGKGKPIPNFGDQAQLVFDVWRERGFPEDTPDIVWVKRYLAVAERIRSGEEPGVDEPLPSMFAEAEMEVVRKLIWGRRSIRDWIDKPIPEEMIEQILEAGNAAPIGCNIGHLRFVVLTSPEEKAMIWSDISTKNAGAIIVVCHDKRVAPAIGHHRLVPQNPGFDAAAAGTQMLLMAHALGLGAVWLSELKETSKTNDTGQEFKVKYGLPDYLEVHFHLALGWTAIGSIKSARPALAGLVIRR